MTIKVTLLVHLLILVSCNHYKNSKKSVSYLSTNPDSTAFLYFGNQADISQDSFRMIFEILKGKQNTLQDSLLVIQWADSFHIKAYDFFMPGSYKVSRDFFNTALNLRLWYYGTNKHIDVSRALLNIGLSFENESDYNAAIRYYDSAYQSSVGDSNPFFPEFKILYYAGKCSKRLGEWEEAFHKFRLADELVEKFFREYSKVGSELSGKVISDVIDFCKEITAVYIKLDSLELLSKLHHRNLEFFKTISATIDTNVSLGICKNELGITSFYQGLSDKTNPNFYFEKSQWYFQDALKHFEKIQDLTRIAEVKRNLSGVFTISKKYEDAKKILQELVENHQWYSSVAAPEQLKIQLNLGTASYRMGRLQQAMEAYTLALQRIDSSADPLIRLPSVDLLSRDPETNLILLGSIGRTALRLAESDPVYKQSARWAYDSLFHLINFIRANMINDQAKLQLASQSQQWLPDAFSDMKSLYLRYSDSAFLDQAFQLVEQDKAFTLIEASRLKNATQLLPDHLQKQQEELSQLELRLSPSDSSKEMLVRKRLEFFEKLKREAPSYYALKYRGPDLSTEYIQKHLLDSNQAILNYFVEENEINVFVITQTGFILDTVSISRVQLKHWIRQFKAHLNPVGKGGEISNEKVDSFQQAAHQLYRILIEHADHKLKLPQRLIVIPHSELNDLSFDALLTDITSHSIPRAVQEGKFLIQSKSISYCFSVSMLDEMMKNTSEPQLQKTLSLYAPEFHPESKTIPELKNQKKEMIAIQHMVQNTKVANQGTKEHFLEDSKKFAYLHLCTHGFVSPDPNSSFIAFRQKSAQNDSNQFFFLRELYHHKMGQDLITLTACETALGDFRLGEGNISLARGFAYAGVRSFITTLWKIQTDGASQIIPGFYNFLFNKHLPKDVALAMSKREFLSRAKGVYPGNWAGMILVGNTSTLALEPASFWSKNGGYGILLIAMLMLIFWFRKHRAGFAA